MGITSGMALKVTQSQNNMIFDCTQFGRFPIRRSEAKYLFFGGNTILRLKKIRKQDGPSWNNYDAFVTPIEALFSMMRGGTLKDKLIITDEESQRNLRFIIRDVLRSMLLKTDGFRTPEYIRDWILFYLKHTSKVPVRLMYHELMNVNHGLQCIFKNKDSDSLSIGSIAAFFCNSETITIYIADLDIIDDALWLSMVSGLSAVLKMGVTSDIRFEFSTIIERWKQKRLYDIAYRVLPQSGCEWKRKVHENTLTFRVVDHDERDDEQKVSGPEISETFQKQIEMMIESLDENDAEYLDMMRQKEAAAFMMQLFHRGAMARTRYLTRLSDTQWAVSIIWVSYRQLQQRRGLQDWLKMQVTAARIDKMEVQPMQAIQPEVQHWQPATVHARNLVFELT